MPGRLVRPGAVSSTMASSWARLPVSWRRAWPSAGARRPIPACRTACSRPAWPGSSRPASAAGALPVRVSRAARRPGSSPASSRARSRPACAGARLGDLLPGDHQDEQRLPVTAGARHRQPAGVQAQRGQHRACAPTGPGLALAAAPAAGGLLALEYQQSRRRPAPAPARSRSCGCPRCHRHPRPRAPPPRSRPAAGRTRRCRCRSAAPRPAARPDRRSPAS